ncbi:acyl carrier protein [Paracoccus aminophilus]|uniref:Carrier domain-containing protein n=1 Tax=Paracoccus aminophilus JCM 7686 TaxID=1367847 RepID=S5Y0Q6_PARAH|nr:acyl carrier protein [Paracoccus aminophilus]AGT11072.1 hypothetical protein JCM7686_pAMI5p006 [Paracoccus aminophilus JCM 7686]
MTLAADDLISYLIEELNIAPPIDLDTELFSSGILDSVSLVSLIGFIEEKARTTIPPVDVTLENFDSVDRIVAYVSSLE